MQAMIDHTAAVVIGATILFILFALSTRSSDSSIEATQVELAKTELRLLIDTVEQDFNNMGAGLGKPNASAADRVVTTYHTSGGYDVLEFSSLQDDTGTPDPVLVRYRWRQQGTATLPDGTTVDTYEVERTSGGATMRFDKATDFTLTLRKKKLDPVPLGSIADSLALVRYVDVELGMIPPVGTENLLQQTRWSKRFRPLNLAAGSQQIIASPP